MTENVLAFLVASKKGEVRAVLAAMRDQRISLNMAQGLEQPCKTAKLKSRL